MRRVVALIGKGHLDGVCGDRDELASRGAVNVDGCTQPDQAARHPSMFGAGFARKGECHDAAGEQMIAGVENQLLR